MNKSLLESHLAHTLDVICLDEVGSTNVHASSLWKSRDISRDTLITAERQTAGRGRLGRHFFSPGGGIYMSIIKPHLFSPAEALLLTPAVAVAVYRAVKKICRISCGIKWVNDIELGGKKLCGILCENLGDAAIIGIGLNFVQSTPFPPEITQTATSLYIGAPEAVAEELTAEIANQLYDIFEELPQTEFLADYRAQSTLLGREILVHTPGGSYNAVACEIDEQARLIVETVAGQRVVLSSGEVSVRRRDMRSL